MSLVCNFIRMTFPIQLPVPICQCCSILITLSSPFVIPVSFARGRPGELCNVFEWDGCLDEVLVYMNPVIA